MHLTTLALLLALSAEPAEPADTQERAAGEGDEGGCSRQIGGATFLLPILQQQSFVSTYVGIREGVAVYHVPDLSIGILGPQDVSLAGYQQTLDLGLRLTRWLGLWGEARGTIFTGLTLSSLLVGGGSFVASGEGGLVLRLLHFESSGTQLSLRAGGGYERGRALTLLPLLSAIVDTPGVTLRSILDGNLREFLLVPLPHPSLHPPLHPPPPPPRPARGAPRAGRPVPGPGARWSLPVAAVLRVREARLAHLQALRPGRGGPRRPGHHRHPVRPGGRAHRGLQAARRSPAAHARAPLHHGPSDGGGAGAHEPEHPLGGTRPLLHGTAQPAARPRGRDRARCRAPHRPRRERQSRDVRPAQARLRPAHPPLHLVSRSESRFFPCAHSRGSCSRSCYWC